jgi:hypothetical protein
VWKESARPEEVLQQVTIRGKLVGDIDLQLRSLLDDTDIRERKGDRECTRRSLTVDKKGYPPGYGKKAVYGGPTCFIKTGTMVS